MQKIEKIIQYKNKEFPVRIHEGSDPKYIFITHHGLLSNNSSFRYMEKWVGENAIIINYDARCNGKNKMKSSRFAFTYVNDFRDVIRWAKETYPDLLAVTIGSSWGASVVSWYAKKYGTSEVYKNVAWSIPYNFISGEEAVETQKKDDKSIDKYKGMGIKKPTKFSWSWKFAVMILTNLNIKEYVKVDLNRTANNTTLKRLDRYNKPEPTPIKLFYSAGKFILTSNKKLRKINKRKKCDFLYLQSEIDSYLTPKKLKQLRQWTGLGVNTIYFREGKHAFQWETENNLNERIFTIVWEWIDK